MAETHKDALRAFDAFVSRYKAKYPKATEKLLKDCDALLAFYAFPAEHWVHLRTTNPIESTFATVRHRTTRTKNCVSRSTFLGLAFKLAEEAAKSWRRIRAPEKVAELLAGTRYADGLPVLDDPPEEQRDAA
jgi:transposase-like protein